MGYSCKYLLYCNGSWRRKREIVVFAEYGNVPNNRDFKQYMRKARAKIKTTNSLVKEKSYDNIIIIKLNMIVVIYLTASVPREIVHVMT